MFYSGQFNLIFGDPESGKTWVALAASAEALNARQRVLMIDLDHNGGASIITRLLSLGLAADTLGELDQFRYVEPEERLEAHGVVDEAQDCPPAVMVIDSLGELVPMFGSSSNSADDFSVVHSGIIRPLFRTGAAVLAIDQLSKGTESRTFGPGGTGARRRTVGGSSIRVRNKDQFAPASGGSAYLTVNKDRHGGLRQHCPPGDREPLAGTFHLRAFAGGALRAEIEPAADGDHAPPDFGIAVRNPERVVDDVRQLDQLDPPLSSKRDAQDRTGWGSDRANKALAAPGK
nr:AAA family ATPase [Dietzia sp. SLG310A2-38A2]